MNRILVAVAACLGLLNLPADEPPETSSIAIVAASEPVAEAKPVAAAIPAKAQPAETPWLKNLHSVRAGDFGGSAVAVSPNTLYTAKHIAGTYSVIWVRVGDQWVKANVTRLPGEQDGATLTLQDGSVPALETRKPEYRESVTVYGLRTRKKMRGIIVRDDMVSLDRDVEGVDSGDSGGGVFGEDGRLVGIARSFDGDHKTGNRRVVYFVPATAFKDDKPRSAALQPPQNCPNGVCKKPQAQPQFYFQQR